MSAVESHGFPKTGRRGMSAALRAEGASAARSELLSSCSISNRSTERNNRMGRAGPSVLRQSRSEAIAKRLPSPAMIVACVALVVALGGVSYAAGVLPNNSVGGAQLQKNAVTGAKLRRNAVTTKKLGKNAVTTFTHTWSAPPESPGRRRGPAR
jgi:hypothetical protein